jgi:hypothetical protein
MFSVCIPRIFNNIPTSKIVDTFNSLQLGQVESIDIVFKKGNNDKIVKMAFIYFKKWYTNVSATNLRNKIEDPFCEAKLIYDDPWYWIILPNNSVNKITSVTNNYIKKINILEFELNNIYNKLRKEKQYYKVYPKQKINIINNNIDERDISDISDETYKIDRESDNNSEESDNISIINYYSNKNDESTMYKDKLWMTINICDNA